MNRDSLQSFGHWELKSQLGLGGFGEVHLWQNAKTGQKIATKRLKENYNLSTDEISKLRQRWLQEHEWMLKLKTPYIVHGLPLEDEDEDFKLYLNSRHSWKQLPVIAMEYCNGGDLRTQLLKTENINGLQEFEVRQVMYALRHAVQYLHDQCRIEHRDLKPDNIVIHQENGKYFYKLTDFGLARRITENTVLKSIVGTRNYVAPEVLDTAKYKNTADYWSIGIIAFELICGILPFIPHQQLIQIIKNIRKKPVNCIAITEDYQHGIDGSNAKFNFHTNIFPENRMSSVFLNKMEKWLPLALDVDYKTRGTTPALTTLRTNERILSFYKDLDALLESKVLTVFCLNRFEFYDYEILPDMSLQSWIRNVVKDMKIEKNNIYCVFPTGHPKRELTESYKPINFFVEEWEDKQKNHNPPVMLYVVGYQCDYSASNPAISDLLKKYLHEKNKLPDWLLQLYEKHTYFLLSNEQRYLETHLTGLKEYAMTIEDEIFAFDIRLNKLRPLYNDIVDIRGRIEQFQMHIQCAKEASNYEQFKNHSQFFEEWVKKADEYKMMVVECEKIIRKVESRYNSALRHAKEEAKNPIFDELKCTDIYGLETFSLHLEKTAQNISNSSERLETCQSLIYNCLDKRKNFLSNKRLNKSRDTITGVHIEFYALKTLVEQNHTFLSKQKSNLQRDTSDFTNNLMGIYSNNIPIQCKAHQNDLAHDGISLMPSINPSSNDQQSINDILETPTDAIFESLQITMNSINLHLKECSNISDLPTTIDQW